ncbi:MAG: AraC family transcriptional regulator N-terminal domain-containing protein, partial [Actinomycetota bacterium]
MSQRAIRRLIEDQVSDDGLVDTGVPGVQLFRVTEPVRCAPAVYEPTLVAIVSGTKEAIFDGTSHVYDSSRYMCCAISMPVEAGTPTASPTDPLLGVQIALDSRVMTELAIEMERATGAIREPSGGPIPQGFALARWDDAFTDALLRLVRLSGHPMDAALLGDGRLREVYYALLQGDAGAAARRSFGVGNEIARVIEHVSSHLDEPITIDDMAARVGMSRAVF